MSSLTQKLRSQSKALYNKAVEGMTVDPTTSDYKESEVKKAIAALIVIDIEQQKLKEAQVHLDRLAKVPGDEDDEDDEEEADESGAIQLKLNGDVFPYMPSRLIRDGIGNIVEHSKALAHHLRADWERSKKHRVRVQRWERRKKYTFEHHRQWADKQKKKGRPALDLTWGNCVHETKLAK